VGGTGPYFAVTDGTTPSDGPGAGPSRSPAGRL